LRIIAASSPPAARDTAFDRATTKSQNPTEGTQFQQGCGAFSAKIFYKAVSTLATPEAFSN
jgi:hypothetical protein